MQGCAAGRHGTAAGLPSTLRRPVEDRGPDPRLEGRYDLGRGGCVERGRGVSVCGVAWERTKDL